MPNIESILPAEWAPQSAVQLTWPHPHGDWASRLARVEPVFCAIAREISLREKVLIACFDEGHQRHIADQLTRAGIDPSQVRLAIAASNDTWARDHGPITVLQNGQPRLLDFQFNGWGGKYRAELDNRITQTLHAAGMFGETPMSEVELVLEGGSIDVDGLGTLLTTSRCLLAPTRNPGLSRAELESQLARQLGIRRTLWLEHGYLAGDDTDSHVDTLARFCDPHTIAYVRCTDPRDEHYVELKHMEDELRALRTATGETYRLVPLPWPAARYDEEGRRLPATYANFLIINGAVLVPTYEDPNDQAALDALASCFPDRAIVAVPCLPLIYQYGSLHCVTMQLPAGVVP